MSEFFIQKKTTSGEFCCKHRKEGKENYVVIKVSRGRKKKK